MKPNRPLKILNHCCLGKIQNPEGTDKVADGTVGTETGTGIMVVGKDR